MNYLCIDYGTKRVGVAIATTPIAEPLEIIPNSTKSMDDVASPFVFRRIQELLDLHAIEKIIIGISEERMAVQTRRFINELETSTSLPIEEMDETLTSYEAYQQMRPMKKSKREGDRDHYAAATILQNYLDLHEQRLDTISETSSMEE
jgi:putative Holliday junction resolvase